MGVPIKKIKRFLEGALARAEDCEIVLYQVNVAGRRAPVWNSEKKWSIDEASASIAESAQGVADGGQGNSRFTMQALDPESDHRPIATMGFVLTPEDVAGEDNSASEPPSMEGLLAQLMRHNSDLHRQSSGTWGLMFQYMTRIIERQSDQLERLQTEKMNAAETMEALISKKHQRDLETKQIESEIKRKDEIFGKIVTLLPVAINKLAGKEIVRQNDTAFEITSSEFLKTITGDRMDQIMNSGLFDKNQLTLLITMLEQLSKRMITAEEKNNQGKEANKAVFGTFGQAVAGIIQTGLSK